MDIKSQKHQTTLCSRRLLLSSPSRSLTLTQFHDILSTTKTRSTFIFPSTMGSTNLDRFRPLAMLTKPPPNTGSLRAPSDLPSFRSLTRSCFPNPMMELSRSTREEAKQSVHCISPLVFASPHWLSFTTPSSGINGKIASNPFCQKRGLDEFKPMYAKLPIAML